jgi:hypothetical protein
MQNAEFRMQNAESSMSDAEGRRRRGITILEVLFAILVTSVGLLSAIAIFPVASAQARRARLNDQMSAGGHAAVHDFTSRGMTKPSNWVAWDPANASFVSDFLPPSTVLANRSPGEAYCIDPRLMAGQMGIINVGGKPKQILGVPANGAFSPNSSPGGACVQTFPYTEPFADSNANGRFDTTESFNDLNLNGIHDPPQFTPSWSFDTSLMRRITLKSSASVDALAPAMMPSQADAVFMVDDDLNYQRPTSDKSLRPLQSATPLPQSPFGPGTANWGRRLTDGKMSWIATLVPQIDVSTTLSSTTPTSDYKLSIVMIYERTPTLTPSFNQELVIDYLKERVVNGELQNGTGVTGGEIIFRSTGSTDQCAEQLNIKPNDWVMVSGTYRDTSLPIQEYSRFQWYRVASCDKEPVLNTNLSPNVYELNATLIGEDWNLDFTNPPSGPSLGLQVGPTGGTPVRVTIVDGAYAVYEKTVRLEQ